MYITGNIADLLHKTSILVKQHYFLKGEHGLLCLDNVLDIWCDEANKLSSYSGTTPNTATFCYLTSV
jgi:hypothetical protein